jgi:7,8-dihydroneopterin aldolase/epimerase/oxygenase
MATWEMGTSEEWIEIVELEVKSRIGVTEEERLAFQRLVLSLRFQILRRFEELQDQLASTVDYRAVAAEAHRIARETEVRLVETLVSEIANGLMDRFPIHRLEIEMRKFILADVRYVSVKTTRCRA